MTQEHGGREAVDEEASEAPATAHLFHRDGLAALPARPEHRRAT